MENVIACAATADSRSTRRVIDMNDFAAPLLAVVLSAYLSVCMMIYSTGNPMVGFAVALLLTVVFTFLTGWIAGRRGRSTKLWYWLGAILGPIALLVIVLLSPARAGPDGLTR
jgi:peptidoglycan/LPS O-acetylase OafA/YrhL